MLDIPSGLASLKAYYSDDKVEEEAYKPNPFLAIVPKFTKWTGVTFNEALLYEDLQGSATFSNAQANGGQYQAVQFALTEVEDYTIAQIANRQILASGDDRGAFLEAGKTSVSSALRGTARSLGQSLFLDGTGRIGQVAAINGNVITLASVTDAVNFSQNQVLDATNGPNGGAALRAGTMLVTNIDRANGLITCAGGLVAGLTANDYLVRDGDYNKKITGLRGWLPMPGDNGSTAPNRLGAGDSFFGVPRTPDVTRLAGWYQDCRNIPLPEAFELTGELLDREGGSPDYIVLNPTNIALLKNQLGGKVIYESVEAFNNPQISFPAVKYDGPTGPVKIIGDRQCPINVGYMLQMDTWTLRSRGKSPRIISYDMEGLEAVRIYNQDGIELRCGYYAQLGCRAPGFNAVMQLQ